MAYVLQADALNKDRAKTVQQLTACDRDLVVVDAQYGTGDEGLWTKEEIKTIRAGKAGRKVVAYLSIGEAENYRPYWQKAWSGKEGAAPAFLLKENPEWKGNFRVKYWHAEWQATILKYLDDIVARGFDGAYLDIVDGFEFFEEDKGSYLDDCKNPETGKTYRQDMIEWVQAVAKRAREKAPDFLVIPQNGSQLLRARTFLETVNAIGIEDLFTENNKLQPKAHYQEILKDLKLLQAQGKPVLLVEYARQQKARETAIAMARENGFALLLADRQLKTLGVVPGR